MAWNRWWERSERERARDRDRQAEQRENDALQRMMRNRVGQNLSGFQASGAPASAGNNRGSNPVAQAVLNAILSRRGNNASGASNAASQAALNAILSGRGNNRPGSGGGVSQAFLNTLLAGRGNTHPGSGNASLTPRGGNAGWLGSDFDNLSPNHGGVGSSIANQTNFDSSHLFGSDAADMLGNDPTQGMDDFLDRFNNYSSPAATQDTLFATATCQASLEDWVVDNPFNNTENQSSSTQQNSGDSNNSGGSSGSGKIEFPFSFTTETVVVMVGEQNEQPDDGLHADQLNVPYPNAWNFAATQVWDAQNGEGSYTIPLATNPVWSPEVVHPEQTWLFDETPANSQNPSVSVVIVQQEVDFPISPNTASPPENEDKEKHELTADEIEDTLLNFVGMPVVGWIATALLAAKWAKEYSELPAEERLGFLAGKVWKYAKAWLLDKLGEVILGRVMEETFPEGATPSKLDGPKPDSPNGGLFDPGEGTSGGGPGIIYNKDTEVELPPDKMTHQGYWMSCTPACAVQYLKEQGVEISEEALIDYMNTERSSGGTFPYAAADGLNQAIKGTHLEGMIRFEREFADNTDIKSFANVVDSQGSTITFIEHHAVIVDKVDVNNGLVEIRDPYGSMPVRDLNEEIVNPEGKATAGIIPWERFTDYWRRNKYQFIKALK